MLRRASPGLLRQLVLRLPAGVSRQQFACASFKRKNKKSSQRRYCRHYRSRMHALVLNRSRRALLTCQRRGRACGNGDSRGSTEGGSGSSWYAEVKLGHRRGGDGRGDLALRERADRFSDSPDCHSKVRRTHLRAREAIIHTGSMKAQRDASKALFHSETFLFFFFLYILILQ